MSRKKNHNSLPARARAVLLTPSLLIAFCAMKEYEKPVEEVVTDQGLLKNVIRTCLVANTGHYRQIN